MSALACVSLRFCCKSIHSTVHRVSRCLHFYASRDLVRCYCFSCMERVCALDNRMSSRRNWCIAVCSARVYIRLSVKPSEGIVIEASEIASLSIRTVEVFLYGPESTTDEWLVIEPAQMVPEAAFARISTSLREFRTLGSNNRMWVSREGRRLVIGWKWCHPPIRTFLGQIARECPSIVISPEAHSNLDLNGFWKGTSQDIGEEGRKLLFQAIHLGFGPNCRRLLTRHKYKSPKEAKELLAEIEQEYSGLGRHSEAKNDAATGESQL